MNHSMNEDEILSEISGTELCEQVRRLRGVYALLSEKQQAAHRELLVTMSEFGLLTDECDPEDTERELLPAALRRAIDKVRLFMELEEEKEP